MKNGESKILTLNFLPPDSGYIFCKFTFDNNLCPDKFYATGGFPGKKASIRTLKLIQPNGGEVFLAESDTIITWEGVSPDEPVTIEYRTDDNKPWVKLTDTAKGLSYMFHVPKIASNKYLARITGKTRYESNCNDVQICNQIWMGCNLDIDYYRNGDPIPEVKDHTQWENLTTGAWCYNNNDSTNGKIYGKLYNWYAVNDPRGLAPEDWHIPTNEEWIELENCLGDIKTAGGKLKSTGTFENGDGLWYAPNVGATNSSGFSGIPGGLRGIEYGTDWGLIGQCAFFWTSTEIGEQAWERGLGNNFSYIHFAYKPKYFSCSVRCVRDK